MFNKILSIGWDVGGWMGNKQGIAAVLWTIGDSDIEWLGIPVETAIPKGSIFTPDYLIGLISRNYVCTPLDNTRIIIAIDSPLGFPDAFRRLVCQEEQVLYRTDKEIDNPLAYRCTEQHICSVFGKKPLSATFDKLGNNCTVAVYHMQRWRKEQGYVAYPYDDDNEDSKAIIEVYPALLKNKAGEVKNEVKLHLPKGILEGTDAYDACLCAFLGILYGAEGRFNDFPKLVKPTSDSISNSTEGWIYYLPPSFLAR